MYSRRPTLNSLEGDRTPPATGEMGQAIQVRHLDLAFGRPDLPVLPLFQVSSVEVIKLFLSHTPSASLPLPGCMLWNQHFLCGAPLFWLTVVRTVGLRLMPRLGTSHPCPDHAQRPREVYSSTTPRLFHTLRGRGGDQTHFLSELKLSSLLSLPHSVLFSTSLLLSILSPSLSLSAALTPSFHRHHWEHQCQHTNRREPKFKSHLFQEAKSSWSTDVFLPPLMGRGFRIHGSFQKKGKLQGRNVGRQLLLTQSVYCCTETNFW